MTFRTERDSLGDRDVPADVYFRIQTTRAVENFPISRGTDDLETASADLCDLNLGATAVCAGLDAGKTGHAALQHAPRREPDR